MTKKVSSILKITYWNITKKLIIKKKPTIMKYSYVSN